jgi:hypothetical protein
MNAMEWLVRQLAWEQRLGQLRSGNRNPLEPARDEGRRTDTQRQAA